MKHVALIGGLLTATLCLSSCGDELKRMAEAEPVYAVDQQLRQTIFQECLAMVPKGPSKTVYNDWSEVVSECGSQAYYQALVCTKNCERSTVTTKGNK